MYLKKRKKRCKIEKENKNVKIHSLEMIIQVPTYEGIKVSIVKYNKGQLEGETNLKAKVEP